LSTRNSHDVKAQIDAVAENTLFIGAMSKQLLVRLVLNGDRVVAEEKLLTDLKQRIREVRQAPDGSIYIFAGASLVRPTPKR
jgi:glucose/arabinose dehydrogenase